MPPIKPENRNRYPDNWGEIRQDILLRADDRCEFCKRPDRKEVVVGKNGEWSYEGQWYNDKGIQIPASQPSLAINSGDLPFGCKAVQVVLTIAHWPDPTPENCSYDNLLALCQRCHNKLDAPMRSEHATQTKLAKKRQALEKAGQASLFTHGDSDD